MESVLHSIDIVVVALMVIAAIFCGITLIDEFVTGREYDDFDPVIAAFKAAAVIVLLYVSWRML